MEGKLQDKYPRQRLLFFVAQDIDDGIVSAVKQTIRDLSRENTWLLAAPVFMDNQDEAQTRDGDLPDRTVGGVLEILGAAGGRLPRDLDAATFADVDRLVQAIRLLSVELSLEVEFELDGAYVGAIDEGEFDRSLAEGLLGEWRRHLEGV
jgi:hypothetical protein